jgi:uncharacterized membrane protein
MIDQGDRARAAGRNQGAGTRGDRAELIISRLLRGGVLTSLTLVVVGTILSFVHHPEYLRSASAYHDLTGPRTDALHSLRGVAAGIQHLRGQAVVALGLVVLIATPVMRVAVSIALFLKRGDRTFAVITSVVLSLLLASFVLGKAGG